MNTTTLAALLNRNLSSSRSSSQLIASSRFADPGQKIGIEFELEDWSGTADFASHWAVHSDASLRNGIEFVFSRGKFGAEAENALAVFAEAAANCTFTTSERTSTHIHMDMGDGRTVGDVRKMFVLTYLIEPAMFRFADENRKWCSYCQPLSDMTQARINSILAASNASELLSAFSGTRHQDKYYGFNLASLRRHSTIEFRYFPGYSNLATVDRWINLVQEVKLAALSVGSIEELLAIGMDEGRMARFLTERMPRSVAAGLLGGLDSHDSVKRANFLNVIMATSDIPTAALHRRLQNVGHDSAAARMLEVLFSMRFDAASQRTELLRGVLNSGSLSPSDIEAMRVVISQMANGAEYERFISSVINERN